MSTTVGNAIKNRASNEEILTILKDVPNPNQDDDDGGSALHFFIFFNVTWSQFQKYSHGQYWQNCANDNT